jgi:hypothetical protein
MEATSVPDFLSKCLKNAPPDKEGVSVFYRGINMIPPKGKEHLPSLYHAKGNLYEHEDDIFNEIISVFPEQMLAQKLTVEKLFLMRHYGFPTRLLDISKNPLVDLFFACFADKGCENTKNKDGVVYIYGFPTDDIKYSDSDTVTMLANICKISSKKFREDYEKASGALVFEIQQERIGFHKEIMEEENKKNNVLDKVVCVRPRMNNPRIIRQDGCFFLFGIKDEKANCAKMPQGWIKDKIIIPWQCKENILADLDTMNNNESFFYHDFEHLNDVIRRRYIKQGTAK